MDREIYERIERQSFEAESISAGEAVTSTRAL